jgi:WD40 repeat protein
MLITSCATKKEIKVWQCGVSTDGKLEVALLRTFLVDEYIDYDGIDLNEVAPSLQLWMECHSSFDGTKIILGVQLFYQVRFTAHKRGFINVIDMDTGSRTQFLRNHSEVDFIAGLCASTVDNKFAAILGRYFYVWDIDAGPAMPLHRFPSPDLYHVPFGFSRSMILDTVNDSLVTSGMLIMVYETQSWTQTISWGDVQPLVSMDPICYFLEFCPGGSDLLSCHPLMKTVIVWNSLTGEMIRRIDGFDRLPVDSVRWCAVGNLLLSQLGGNMKILNSTSGEELCCWKAHESRAALCSVPPALNILL